MIVKSFELQKINLVRDKLLLFYGDNEGFKKQVIEKLIENKNNIYSYEENQILDNENNFLNELFSKSLFEKEKIIIIKRSSDKIFKIIQEVYNQNIEDIVIIIDSKTLEKKSKLRKFFEKEKKLICVPFYPDNSQILSKLAFDFFKENNIKISQIDINQIVIKCNNNRQNLYNELSKLKNFSRSGKKLDSETIAKLTNLSENHSISELVDNCLAKNKKKLIFIFNENNLTNEDCIIITRIFLNKSKKILKLLDEYKVNNDLNLTISSAKPPIFWKDKEIIKQQMQRWSIENLRNLIYKISDLELLIKKNVKNSINLTTDFLIEQSS